MRVVPAPTGPGIRRHVERYPRSKLEIDFDITLEKPDGSPLGTYLPGAHIDVEGPTAITRQSSLCSAPDAADSFAFSVKREANSQGGSVALHELAAGDTLRISEPRNLLGIAADAHHHVLVATGIGITPMLSTARYMDVHGISFELHSSPAPKVKPRSFRC